MAQQQSEVPIPIESYNMAGLADSRWNGIKNSLYRFVGWDPHSVPGILRVAQKLTKDSGSVVKEFCKARLASSNGCDYWGSSTSGKIWQCDSTGVWTLVWTVSPTLGEANILELVEFQGYIYIFTEKRVHRILAADAIGASEWGTGIVPNHYVPDWKTFTNGDKEFHPAFELNLVLYIGDGSLVAQIGDTGTFTADALDINDPLRTKSLGKMGVDLLIGTYVSDNITKTQIYRWNTYSDSFSVSDTIDEVGINAFLEADNFVYASCGYAGNIYQYDGEKLILYKKIPGDYSPVKQCTVYPNAVGNIEGQILFGVSNVIGNPCDLGVFRIGRNSLNYPYIMDLPYPILDEDTDEMLLTNIEIGAILVAGTDIFVSWKRTIPGDPNVYSYGISKLDWNNKLNGAFYESRVITSQRDIFTNFSKFIAAYHLLPENTEIALAYSKNYADYVDTDVKVDSDRNIVFAEAEGVEATTLQMRVTATVSGNDAPEIEKAMVFIR